MDADGTILNAQQAAAYLGVHRETLRRLARRGRIPCFKVGKDWRFRREALDRWAARKSPAPGRLDVLVLDPDQARRRSVCELIALMGHRAEGAPGMGAIGETSFAPQAILVDQALLEDSGEALLEALGQSFGRTPTAVIVERISDGLIDRFLSRGPLLLLARPIQVSHLEPLLALMSGRA